MGQFSLRISPSVTPMSATPLSVLERRRAREPWGVWFACLLGRSSSRLTHPGLEFPAKFEKRFSGSILGGICLLWEGWRMSLVVEELHDFWFVEEVVGTKVAQQKVWSTKTPLHLWEPERRNFQTKPTPIVATTKVVK